MTFKQLVLYIAKKEGLKRQVNIAQISEITRHTLIKLAHSKKDEVVALLARYNSK